MKKYKVKIFYERNSLSSTEYTAKIDWFAWTNVDETPTIEEVKAFLTCFIPSATLKKITIEATLNTENYSRG